MKEVFIVEEDVERIAQMNCGESRKVTIGGIVYNVVSHFDKAMNIGATLESLALTSVLGDSYDAKAANLQCRHIYSPEPRG